jgi:hypothetical protein
MDRVSLPIFALAWARFPDLARIGCVDPACGAGALVWHQPDIARPGRLLGICSGCGSWYIAQRARRGDGAACIRLPGGDYLPEAPRQ